jgi:Putative Ig domain
MAVNAPFDAPIVDRTPLWGTAVSARNVASQSGCADICVLAQCADTGVLNRKPIERWGRKASGLRALAYDSGVAGITQCGLVRIDGHTCPKGSWQRAVFCSIPKTPVLMRLAHRAQAHRLMEEKELKTLTTLLVIGITVAGWAGTSTAAPLSASNSGTDNSPPQISGVAATTAKVGQTYSFQPSATDADNHTLTFSVSGAPSWLTFSAATGRISGTPRSADVGEVKSILLQVSDGTRSVSLAPFTITVLAVGSNSGSASLSWQAPTDNTNGSALSNLMGYTIHYGSVSKVYTSRIRITNPGITTYVVEDLPPGTYYFSMTSTTTNGAHSKLSPEIKLTIS